MATIKEIVRQWRQADLNTREAMDEIAKIAEAGLPDGPRRVTRVTPSLDGVQCTGPNTPAIGSFCVLEKNQLTVGQLRVVMDPLPDDALVGVDYDALAIANCDQVAGVWGAYSDGETFLAIVR